MTRSARGLPASIALESLVRSRHLPSVEIEISRALENVENDPPAAVCAANSLLEALLKVYIEDESLEMPSKKVLKSLWKVVQRDLGQNPDQVEDVHIKKVLSGQTSIVDGIAGLRTHASSAHGHGRKRYRIDSRIAKHVVYAAHGFALFLLETWEMRSISRAGENEIDDDERAATVGIPDVLSRIRQGHFASLPARREA